MSEIDTALNDIALLALGVCKTPFAGITLIDESRHGFTIKVGLNLPEDSNALSFCTYATMTKQILTVRNALLDERFNQNPLVSGPPQIRFFVVVPLRTGENRVLGTLFLFDIEPRDLTEFQKRALEILTSQILAQMELIRIKSELEHTNKELEVAFSGLVRAHSKSLEQQVRLVDSEKMAVLGEMASAIVHEINNPLAILQLESDAMKSLAQGKSFDTSVLVESCAQIEKTILRISKVIKASRSFARMADQDPFQPISLKDLIENTVELCHHKLSVENINFQIPQIDPKLTIECRESQIAQVLLNLVNNASDAISSQEKKWIRIEINDLEKEVIISVTDSGKGIPPELKSKLFQPFFTSKDSGKGTGLGLSISKKIITSHSGDLAIDSNSSNTKFVVKLPKQQSVELPD